MKSLLILLVLLSSLPALAVRVECSTKDHKFILENVRNEINITHKNETVLADGLLNAEEVDIVAKFRSIGEMTLFAKVNKVSPENYVFIKGKRFSVICR